MCYLLVDVKLNSRLTKLSDYFRMLLFPFEAMGMNAIFFFFWHGTAEAIINAVYIDPPAFGGALSHKKESGALLGKDGVIRSHIFCSWFGDAAAAQLCLVLLKIGVFLSIACACHRYQYFWKI